MILSHYGDVDVRTTQGVDEKGATRNVASTQRLSIWLAAEASTRWPNRC
jgi:hypothetical protein